MKNLILIATFLFSMNAGATYIDLRKGVVIAKAPCKDSGKQYTCVGVELDDEVYVVLLDNKGEFAIYLLSENGPELIWARDLV
jgi:hypothetical protein